jgi:hypothetical protein
VFVPLKVLEPFWVAKVEGRRGALMAVTTLSPADTLTPEAIVAVVAEAALPSRAAVMVPAEKLPEASRLTMVFGSLVFDEPFTNVIADPMFAALCPPTRLLCLYD